MDRPVLTREFPTIGKVQYKIASTRQEVEQALSLVFHEYAKRGLIDPKKYKSPLRIGLHHILPQTNIFIGLRDGEVIITMSTFHDSPLGLPLDSGYREEFQKFRAQGRNIGEAGYLGIKSGMFPRKKNLFHHLEKIDFICTLPRMAIQHALRHTPADDACFVTNPEPKRKLFKIFPFETVGEVKDFGFDEIHINPKPAIAKRLDLRSLKETRKNLWNPFRWRFLFFNLALGRTIPEEFFQHRFQANKKDLYYFFVEKSDVWRNLKPPQREYVLSCYNLNPQDYENILAGKTE